MAKITDLAPVSPESRHEQRLKQAAIDAGEPVGFGAAIDAAVNVQSVIPWAVRAAHRATVLPDPNFSLSTEQVKQLTDGIPEDYWDAFEGASSEEEARLIRIQLLDLAESRERLSRLGVGGVALEIGAAILDPVALSAGAGIGGAAKGIGAYRALSAGTRVNRFIAGGLATAASEVPIEAFLATQDPLRGPDDILWSVAGSFALGGGLPAALAPRGIKAAQSLQRSLDRAALQEAGATLTADGQKVMAAEWWEAEVQEYVRNVTRALVEEAGVGHITGPFALRNADARELVLEALNNPRSDEFSVRAARDILRSELAGQIADAFGIDNANAQRLVDATLDPGTTRSVLNVTDSLDADAGEIQQIRDAMGAAGQSLTFQREPSRAAFSRLRFGMAARMQSSSIPTIRNLATVMAEDAIPNIDGAPVREAATEFAMREHRVRLTKFRRHRQATLRDWMKANGKSRLQSIAAAEEFDEEVGRALRRDPGEWTDDPHINAAADYIRTHNADLLRAVKEGGVRGFENVDESATYFTRIWSVEKLRRAIDNLGGDRVRSLFAGAIRASNDELTDDEALKVASSFMDTLLRKNYTAPQVSQLFSGENAELLRQTLKDAGNLSDAQIDDILQKVGRKPPEGALTARSKRRALIDETFALDFPVHRIDADGTRSTTAGRLSIEDLLENNANAITTIYTRQMTGALAFQRVLDAAKRSPDDDLATVDALRARIEREASQVSASKADFDLNMKRFDVLQRAIRGLPLGSDTAVGEFLRGARMYSFVRSMNQVGFAQVAELGQIVGEYGVRTMLQQSPALSRMFRTARTGRLSDEFLAEIEEAWAHGTDFLRNEPLALFDQESALPGSRRATRVLERAGRITNIASGMATIDTALRRTATAAAVQKWANFAASGKLPSDLRLAGMGLTRADAEKIVAQVRKHFTTEQGTLGARVRRMNIEAWDDQEAASKFIVAIDKWGRRVIQDNDIGAMALWMTGDLGRLMVQFRFFVLQAWEKQSLYALRMHDLTAFSAFMHTMFFGSLAYLAQTYLNSIGRDDREEYLETRLNPEAVAKAAFQRSGYSSILPPAVDSVAGLAGFQPVFNNYARTTGLASGLITGSPVFDLADNAARALRGATSAAQPDNNFSRQDLEAWFRLMPFQNMLGVRNVLNKIAGELPDE